MEFSIVLSKLLTSWLLFRRPGDRMASVSVKSLCPRYSTKKEKWRILSLLFDPSIVFSCDNDCQYQEEAELREWWNPRVFVGPTQGTLSRGPETESSKSSVVGCFYIYFLLISYSHTRSISYFLFIWHVVGCLDVYTTTRTNSIVIKPALLPLFLGKKKKKNYKDKKGYCRVCVCVSCLSF